MAGRCQPTCNLHAKEAFNREWSRAARCRVALAVAQGVGRQLIDFFDQRGQRTACRVQPLTEATFDLGRYLAERHQLRVYDAMIVASALEAGCTTLWSEDMHHGLLVENHLRIRNPVLPQSVQSWGVGGVAPTYGS